MENLSRKAGAAPEAPVDLSTAALRDRDKLSFWQDVMSTHLAPSVFSQPSRRDAFDGRLRCVSIGQIGIAQLDCDPLLAVRDAQCIRRQPDDDYFVAVARSTTSRLNQNQRTASVNDGDVVVYGSSTPFEWESSSTNGALIARFPRRQIVSRIPHIDLLTARVIKASNPLGSILSHTIREIARLHDENPDDSVAQRSSVLVTELVASSIEAALAPLDRNLLTDDLLMKAKSLLQKSIEDPECDLSVVTDKLGISTRTIFRIFATEDTTPMRWLWKQRLEMAFRLLSEGKVRTVSQAAMQAGFNDFAHFSRSFRKEYGATPLSILRRGS